LTDSGRQVTGGGGITPDIVVKEPEPDRFQKALYQMDVFFPLDSSVGGFTRHFLGTRPVITKEFEADDAVMAEFRKYLASQHVRYTEPEFAENLTWVKRKIKEEVFVSTFGQPEGFKVQLEADPQLLAAIEAVPQARALYQKARKIVAQREGNASIQP
jgi:carboxyl-terminal processing protease